MLTFSAMLSRASTSQRTSDETSAYQMGKILGNFFGHCSQTFSGSKHPLFSWVCASISQRGRDLGISHPYKVFDGNFSGNFRVGRASGPLHWYDQRRHSNALSKLQFKHHRARAL
jgi:hypothetical protein